MRSALNWLSCAVLLVTTAGCAKRTPGLTIEVASSAKVGEDFTVRAVFADQNGKAVPDFWASHGYELKWWPKEGQQVQLVEIKPPTVDSSGVLNATYRAGAPGVCEIYCNAYATNETYWQTLDRVKDQEDKKALLGAQLDYDRSDAIQAGSHDLEEAKRLNPTVGSKRIDFIVKQ